ncbi:hypothetical protein [Paenibacillus sp. DYY-L-2]|uniref:hypothetical protein n=1 Tax=Paenibacillus sp. DYY-L-2 TaxID=3447013 RepID=UPI003F506EC3
MIVVELSNKRRIVLLVIKRSSIQKFIVIDLILGTGIYYVAKIISSSAIVATIGSMIGTEAVKKLRGKDGIT